MEFRLIYHGALPSQTSGGSSRVREKHTIRKEFHKQMKELWKQNKFLRGFTERVFESPEHGRPDDSWIISTSEQYPLKDFRFLPLINYEAGLACSLNILFLRRDDGGKLIQSGGDLDNRIKVLFDALRKPHNESEIEGFTPDEDEKPFYCLLEDDSLINEVSVTTDRLLLQQKEREHINDVMLVIHVKTLITDSSKAYIEFYT